jgi:hypothetical protein
MENQDNEESDLIIRCDNYTHLVEVCDFSDLDSDSSEKTICLSFYHTVERKSFLKSLFERFRGAFSYFFFGKAASVEVVLNEKSAKKLVDKINKIIQ